MVTNNLKEDASHPDGYSNDLENANGVLRVRIHPDIDGRRDHTRTGSALEKEVSEPGHEAMARLWALRIEFQEFFVPCVEAIVSHAYVPGEARSPDEYQPVHNEGHNCEGLSSDHSDPLNQQHRQWNKWHETPGDVDDRDVAKEIANDENEKVEHLYGGEHEPIAVAVVEDTLVEVFPPWFRICRGQ